MINTGGISYAVGGSAFLVLSILLATNWRGRLQGGAIVAATAVTAVWSFWLAYQAGLPDPDWALSFLLESLRDGAWLGLLLTLLGVGGPGAGRGPRAVVYGICALWLLALTYRVAVVLGLQQGGASMQIVAALVIALVGLILVEQVYRNTRPEKRWGIKFLVLAVGAMFGYDVFLYSQALLLREIDPSLWSARGLVDSLAVPLIAVAAARNPDWSVNLFVSRQVVFYTTALMGAGIYLLAMAAGGYYIRLHGGTWGTFAQAVFLGGAVLMLAVIMLSGDLRAKARVFLVKHFYKNKYDYRIEWLRLIATLATPEEDAPLPERAAQALAQLVESPGAGLWLQQEGGEFLPVARWGPEPPDGAIEPSGSALVRFLHTRQWVIDLHNWRATPGNYDNLRLPDWLSSQARAWLLVPLMQGAQVLGFVVLTRAHSPAPLTWEDTDLLKTAGRQIASYLAQHQAAQALAQARQFDAYHRLTAFIMHDLKNLIAQQSLVVQNAARHKHNPAFIEDVIRTIENSVTRMNQLLDQLRRGESQSRPKRVALCEVLAESIARQGSMQPVPELEVLEDRLDVLADPQSLSAVLGHVVRNAQEATAPDGHVHVRLRREGSNAVVEIEDNGVGMDASFVSERLFRPFDSTKGSKGMGIGAYQVREFVRAAGGEVQVSSTIGKGTRFRIFLPALVRGQESEALAAIEHQK
jgi:putative PEP-CTERM system histidine kinase